MPNTTDLDTPERPDPTKLNRIRYCLGQFPNDKLTQTIINMAMKGRFATKRVIDTGIIIRKYGYDEQHPPEAYVGGSYSSSDMSIGPAASVGTRLIYRNSYGLAEPCEGGLKPLDSFADFLALTDSKHIGKLPITRYSGCKFIDVVFKGNDSVSEKGAYWPSEYESTAKKFKYLHDEVIKNGLGYYEERGLIFKGSREDNIKYAMAAELLMQEYDVAQDNCHAEIIPILKNDLDRTSRYWNREKGKYVKIPVLDHSLNGHSNIGMTDKQIQAAKKWNESEHKNNLETFFKNLPKDKKRPQGATPISDYDKWENIGCKLLTGATLYKTNKEIEPTDPELLTVLILCSDSREGGKTAVDNADLIQFRTPGKYCTKGGDGDDRNELLEDVAFLMAALKEEIIIAEEKKKELQVAVIIGDHATCGANNIVNSYNDDNTIPIADAFKKMAGRRRETYQLAQEINADECYKMYGIKLEAAPDRVSLMQLYNDKDALEFRYGGDFHFFATFNNMKGGDRYFHSDKGKGMLVQIVSATDKELKIIATQANGHTL